MLLEELLLAPELVFAIVLHASGDLAEQSFAAFLKLFELSSVDRGFEFGLLLLIEVGNIFIEHLGVVSQLLTRVRIVL